MSYVLIVLLVGFLILIHELGHLLAARWVGIPVSRFSIGFGPKLWGFRRGGTEYWLSAVPLGGYVLLEVEDERAYFRIPPRKRLAFALGGPAANLLLPVALLAMAAVLRGDVSLHAVFVAPVVQTWEMTVGLVCLIPQLFANPEGVSGVLGIVVQGGRIVGTDFSRAVQLAVLLSVNLGVLNLLPIPVLDGGKIIMLLMEKLHPKAIRLHLPLTLLGLAFILGLVVYTTVMDIGRLMT